MGVSVGTSRFGAETPSGRFCSCDFFAGDTSGR
jgi:hypothetical protein